jgi:hypothetical protein
MGGKKKDVKEKPLDKMTAKELRELGKQIPGIVGVHAMNKAELLAAVKDARGIVDESPKVKDASVREIKKKIKDLKAECDIALNNKDMKMAAIYQRRIAKLKKKTRRAA